MFISIELESEIPIYQQIRNQIVEGIATGKLKEGDALPSVRQMASDLGINLHTVNKVYTMLKQEGFLTVHRKSGVVVNRKEGFLATTEFYKKMENDIRPIVAEAICRGVAEDDFTAYCEKLYQNFKKLD